MSLTDKLENFFRRDRVIEPTTAADSKAYPQSVFQAQNAANRRPKFSSIFRSLSWAIYLGVAPGDDMKSLVREFKRNRAKYEEIREKYVDMNLENDCDEAEGGDHAKGMMINNSHLDTKNRIWNRSFPKGLPELEIMRRDIERTYSSRAFFRRRSTRKMLERIIYIWMREQQQIPCRHFPEGVTYSQGMNELAAMIVIVLRRDYVHPTVSPSNPQDRYLQRHLMDISYCEHDSFTIFTHLMAYALPFYTSASLDSSNPNAPHPYLYQTIQNIHQNLLKSLDPALHTHLTENGVMPQLFMLRWIRVLFTREFKLEQVLKAWDLLLLSKLKLVEFLCVAMLGSVRDQLFLMDPTELVSFLMRYPSPDDTQMQVLLNLTKSISSKALADFHRDRCGIGRDTIHHPQTGHLLSGTNDGTSGGNTHDKQSHSAQQANSSYGHSSGSTSSSSQRPL